MPEKKDDNKPNPALRKYIHDILNMKTIDAKELEEINNFSFDDRMEILEVYNQMMKNFSNLLEDI